MSKFCCILFSFNRAMQLDLTLRSLETNLIEKDVGYTVIWQCTPSHETSYQMLIDEWENKGIKFKRCDNRFRSAWELRKYLINPRNLYRYLSRPPLRKRFDNFKELVEDTIRQSGSSFAFFSTDDQYVFKLTRIPQTVISRIQADPDNISFRSGMDENLSGKYQLPANMDARRIHYIEHGMAGNLLEWSANDKHATKLWEYSFNVDFQVFDSDALLKLLSPILYHIPTTLEWAGLRESRRKNKFRHLLGTTEKTVIGMQLNLAQTMVQNEATDFSLDTLRTLYEKGYRLTVKEEQLNKLNWLFMPKELFFFRLGRPNELLEFKEIA